MLGLALGILLAASAQQLMAQAQVQVPNAGGEKQEQTPAHPDSAIDRDELVTSDVSLDDWLKDRADELKDILSCYLSEQDMVVELSEEKKNSTDPVKLIEVRIQRLKDMARHNVGQSTANESSPMGSSGDWITSCTACAGASQHQRAHKIEDAFSSHKGGFGLPLGSCSDSARNRVQRL
jgi:hypothetical protein